MQEQATQVRMNEIGSVEFEANVPLFFDPYASNRTTGSFILIDALSNATVGAGMIQEDPVAKRGSAPAEAVANLQIPAGSPVSAEERRIRRGHWPAVLLLEGRQALATRLERHLFEQGFEVLHLTDSAVSTAALSETIRVTQAAESWCSIPVATSMRKPSASSQRIRKAAASTWPNRKLRICLKKSTQGRHLLSRRPSGFLERKRIGKR